MEACTNAVTLRRAGFGLGMVDVLDSQIQLVLVMLEGAAIFCPSLGQNRQQGQFLLLEKGEDPVIEPIGGHERVLAVIQFDQGDFAVSINKGLLLDATNALERADIGAVLTAQIAWMVRFALTFSLALFFGFFQGFHLGCREDHCFVVGQPLFQSLPSFFEGFQTVSQPDRAHPAGRNRLTLFLQFVGDPDLTISWIVRSNLDHGLFDLGLNPIGWQRFPPTELSQTGFARLLIQFLKAIEAVSRVPQDLTSLAHIAQLFG